MAIISIKSDITGTVWKVLVKQGDSVQEDGELVILESMKMEIPVTASEDAVVHEICVVEGQSISEGDVVVTLEV
ncbi:acetyl-CoA carboxylase biotin carboxyl carrier protein subunit [Zwartia vadi]|uniref:acetyl-CoA carboxylase biotin carboxyl carrier protein subunit n=1 Tax=Zwartia vadi TaxID=3058168 RepID=UPI0025B2F7F3|nr:acetyl-CoA carboxylase biotin carboxyl carrier protein subunit [Zwartia vadi]MDN3987384.1 acetyl-CoA carboxylase biotin carboxyl carrier protein subunit [Zwartia vadi]